MSDGLHVSLGDTRCHICSDRGDISIDGNGYCPYHLGLALAEDIYLYHEAQGEFECDNCGDRAVYCGGCGPSKCQECGDTDTDAYCSGCRANACDSCGGTSNDVYCYECTESETEYACIECGSNDSPKCEACRGEEILCDTCGNTLSPDQILCPEHTPVKLPELAVQAAQSGVTVGDIEFRFSN